MTDASTEAIIALFQTFQNEAITGIDKIPQSGSDRTYFRIHTATGSFIATASENIRENDTFIYFSKHFKTAGSPVPAVLAASADRKIYIQEDFGNQALLTCLEQQGHNNNVYTLFEKSLHALAHMQIKGDAGLDYQQCITSQVFGKQAIISDLLYFKYYFLDTLKIPYDKEKLLEELQKLSQGWISNLLNL